MSRANRVDSFRIWRLPHESREVIELPVPSHDHATVVEDAVPHCQFKDTLIVEYVTALGMGSVTYYAIRQAKPTYRRSPITGRSERVIPRYADRLFTMFVKEFEPGTRWRWEPGADVVGHDFTIIEGAPLCR